MTWKTLEIREIRKNHFVTMLDCEAVRVSTPFDHEFNKFFQRGKNVESEAVAMALGLSAISAILVSQTTSLLLQIIGIAAFFFSSGGSYLLFDGFLIQKIPYIVYCCLEPTRKVPIFRGFQYRFHLYKEWLKSVNEQNEIIDVEFGYISLAVGFDFTIYGLAIWIFIIILTSIGFPH